jgi:hypothetical protein
MLLSPSAAIEVASVVLMILNRNASIVRQRMPLHMRMTSHTTCFSTSLARTKTSHPTSPTRHPNLFSHLVATTVTAAPDENETAVAIDTVGDQTAAVHAETHDVIGIAEMIAEMTDAEMIGTTGDDEYSKCRTKYIPCLCTLV